ncbi:major facilitator superfamily domain-containing protein [Phthorimaea operculella]|nr:major facilitator superfamily domain-containing protein [Phthorimaea operculella]
MSFPIYLLQAITFLDLLAVGLIVPLMSDHVRSLGGNYIHVGLLGSLYAFFQLGSRPLFGSLSDIRGRKTILIITLLVCSAAYILTGLTTSVIAILCLRAILGLFKQTQMIARAMVPEYEENVKRQSEIFGRMAAISGVGITIGPICGGHIIEKYPEHGLTYISVAVGLCFLLNTGVVYLLPKTNSLTLSKRKKGKSKRRKNLANSETQSVVKYVWNSLKQSVIELCNIDWSIYWDLFLLKALIGFAMGMYYSNYSAYLKNVHELSPKYVGVRSLAGVIAPMATGVISQYAGVKYPIYVSLFTTFLGLSMSYYTRNYEVKDDYEESDEYETRNATNHKTKTE